MSAIQETQHWVVAERKPPPYKINFSIPPENLRLPPITFPLREHIRTTMKLIFPNKRTAKPHTNVALDPSLVERRQKAIALYNLHQRLHATGALISGTGLGVGLYTGDHSLFGVGISIMLVNTLVSVALGLRPIIKQAMEGDPPTPLKSRDIVFVR